MSQGDGAHDQERNLFLLGLGLILIAFNLRPIFPSFSVLLPEIIVKTNLDARAASYLTTLPVLCLGLFSPMAPRCAERFGAEKSLLGALLLLGLGTALRGLGNRFGLVIGATFAGGAIAFGNVLLPGLVKRYFPHKTAIMTGLYTTALCAGLACAAALTIPLKHYFDDSWTLALAIWAIPAFAVALIWFPQSKNAAAVHPGQTKKKTGSLFLDPVAWQVTLMMGLQSALSYSVFGWLAPILRERGLDAVDAGLAVSVTVAAQAVACLTIPHLLMRLQTQSATILSVTLVTVGSLLGLLFAPLGFVWMWAITLGLAQGSLITIALTIIVLRSPSTAVAAKLSGMAQGLGYTLAAIGPLFVGLLRSWSGNNNSTAVFFVILGVGLAICGWGAGQKRYVTPAP